jgi:hypothetical protein
MKEGMAISLFLVNGRRRRPIKFHPHLDSPISFTPFFFPFFFPPPLFFTARERRKGEPGKPFLTQTQQLQDNKKKL